MMKMYSVIVVLLLAATEPIRSQSNVCSTTGMNIGY